MARSTISNGMCFVLPARPLLDDLLGTWLVGAWLSASGVTSRMSCDPDLGRGVFCLCRSCFFFLVVLVR